MQKPVDVNALRDFQEWKEKYEKEHKLRQEAENEMVLIKGITITNSPELREANKKIKELENRMAELLTVEDEHQKLNGKLQMKLTELEEFNIRVRQEVTAKEQENLELHADNKKLAKDDLILIDAGCEFDFYTADITRTFPANGVFNAAQKACYELVLKAEKIFFMAKYKS